MNAYVNRIKQSIELNKVFANAKCRLRLENITRWGSTFLMLERLKKAHKKGLFETLDSSSKLPVSIDVFNGSYFFDQYF